jgi:hypothetical protein
MNFTAESGDDYRDVCLKPYLPGMTARIDSSAWAATAQDIQEDLPDVL